MVDGHGWNTRSKPALTFLQQKHFFFYGFHIQKMHQCTKKILFFNPQQSSDLCYVRPALLY